MKYKASFYNNVLIDKQSGNTHIYNSFTKARIEVTEEELKNLLTGTDVLDEKKIPYFDILKSNGFIVQADFDEKSALKYIFTKRFFSKSDLSLILMPTLGCNFACPYCFENGEKTKFKYNHKYFEILKNYIKNQKDKITNIHLGFFGGEPLLMKKELIEFSKWVRKFADRNKKGVDSSIVTNGSLVDEELIQVLEYVNCRYLQITIDGSQERHDQMRCFIDGRPSYHLLLDKIQLCAKLLENNKAFKVTLRINLNNNTLEEVEKTLSQIDERYRKKINLLFRTVFNTSEYCLPNENKSNDLERFYDLGVAMGFSALQSPKEFTSCEACCDIHGFHVLPDMSLWKCVVDLSYPEACIGHMNADGTVDFDLQRVIEWYKSSDYSNDEQCVNCKLSPDCFGGCIKFHRQKHERACRAFDVIATVNKYN